MAKTSFWGYIFIYIPTFLAFASFGLLLGGVSAMQQRCGSVNASEPPLGYASYLAAVSCDRFFSFDWWITFFQGFIFFLLFLFIIMKRIHNWRTAITGLLISASILLIFQTNTWYNTFRGLGPQYYNFTSRAKVAFTGALVGSVADILLIMAIGTHMDRPKSATTTGRRGEGRYGGGPEGARVQTYVTTTEEHPPRAETVGYRQGPVAV